MTNRRRLLLLYFWSALWLPALHSQNPSVGDEPSPTDAGAGARLTIFPHPPSTRYLIAGQANIIFQSHPPFHSPYESTNSFISRGEYKTSLLGTLFTGFQLKRDPRFASDFLFDLEFPGAAACPRHSVSPVSPTSTSSAILRSVPHPTSPAFSCAR